MPIIALFIVASLGTFAFFKMRGQRTADCVHKGLVAGIVASVAAVIVVTVLSYL